MKVERTFCYLAKAIHNALQHIAHLQKRTSKEGELKVVALQMTQCAAANYSELNDLAQRQQALEAEVAALMDRWAYLEEIAEAQK